MSRILTPQIGRRHVVKGLATLTVLSLAPGPLSALAAPGLIATPAQTEGPFYPTDWTGDADNDLVLVKGEAARAQGQITHILGRVLDTSGAPIPGAAIEIWQCDATGIYRHPRDTHWFRHARLGLPGARARAHRCGRRLHVPHDQAGLLSGAHAAHPLCRHRAGTRAAHHADVRRRRAAERARWNPQRHCRPAPARQRHREAGAGPRASRSRRWPAPSTSCSDRVAAHHNRAHPAIAGIVPIRAKISLSHKALNRNTGLN